MKNSNTNSKDTIKEEEEEDQQLQELETNGQASENIKDKEAAENRPIPKSGKLPQKCPLSKCLLCTRDQPYCLVRGPTWPAIMRVVFYVLQYDKPDKDFFNLKEDVYNVMLWHWDKLSINKKSSLNWKKHIQDMLSHSKDLFESGLEIYGQNGYWRLKVNTDPWTLSGKTRRTPKKEMIAKRAREAENAAAAAAARTSSPRSSSSSPTSPSNSPSISGEPPLKRPFVPFIVRSGTTPTTCPTNLAYVFINERSQTVDSSLLFEKNKPNNNNTNPNPNINPNNNFMFSHPPLSMLSSSYPQNPSASSPMFSFPSFLPQSSMTVQRGSYVTPGPYREENNTNLNNVNNNLNSNSSSSNNNNNNNNNNTHNSHIQEDGIVPQLCSKFAQFDKEIRMRLSPPTVSSPTVSSPQQQPIPSPEQTESTFKMFANAKPCNPCPVSFLLNE